MTKTTLSVVVEWENVQNSSETRAQRMLSELDSQIRLLPLFVKRPIQVILIYSKDSSLAALPVPYSDTDIQLSTITCDGLDYYSQKNFGARKALGELLLFVDSDVIPDRGWLLSLVMRFVELRPSALCGQTYLDVSNAYEHAMSSFWIFPRQDQVKGPIEVRETDWFFANNVIFNRESFLRQPFPTSMVIRGRCAELATLIASQGGKIILDPAARVSHPAPNGIVHFLKRAMCDGHDAAVRALPHAMLSIARRYASPTLRGVRNVWRGAAADGFNMAQRIFMCTVPIAFYTAAFVGEILTLIAPRWAHDLIRV